MTMFIRSRMAVRRGRAPDVSRAGLAWIFTHIQLALVVVMVFIASFMARGFGVR